MASQLKKQIVMLQIVKRTFEMNPSIGKLYTARGKVFYSEQLAKKTDPKYKTYNRPGAASAKKSTGKSKTTTKSTK